MQRAARFDGVIPMIKKYPEALSTQDVRSMSRFIAAHHDGVEPFNLGVALSSSDDGKAGIARTRLFRGRCQNGWQEGRSEFASSPASLRRGRIARWRCAHGAWERGLVCASRAQGAVEPCQVLADGLA
jgi:hypothetical protein